MSDLRNWLASVPHTIVPLFDTMNGKQVNTHLVGKSQRRLLRRNSQMEEAIIREVENGLDNDDWRGLLYIMGRGDVAGCFSPLYVGKAGRVGTKNELSENLRNIRGNKHKFARWGDGVAYHIGDLSHVLFRWEAYRKPTQKFEAWADMLFENRDPPILRTPIYLALIPWLEASTTPSGRNRTLEEAEEEVIDLSLSEFEDIVLNVVGETWFNQRSSTKARPGNVYEPRRPIQLVASPQDMRQLCDRLAAEDLLGVDVETAPWTQDLCTIQIATRTETAVIDALAVDDLTPLAGVFSANEPTKVAHNASFERRVLGEHGLELKGIADTLRMSRNTRGTGVKGGHSLAAVCKRELGIALDKSEQRSDWSRRPLSQSQLAYAAVDAEVLIDLYEWLRNARSGLPFED